MKKYNMQRIFKFTIVSLFLIWPLFAHAETVDGVPDPKQLVDVFIVSVCGFLILSLLFMLYLLKVMLDHLRPSTVAAKKPLLAGWIQKLADAVPVEEEEAILTDHDYDGIRELDNNLPLWWKYMFYLTIACGLFYFYYYHVSDMGTLQIEEYEQELIRAEKDLEEYRKQAANSIDENNVTPLSDAVQLENGKTLFLQNCSACHGKSGEGSVGPNLTDEYWLHGGGVKAVFKTIKYGVPEKGMISWKTQLSPGNMQEVTSYILTLKGTKPANAKAPQGDKYEEEKENQAQTAK